MTCRSSLCFFCVCHTQYGTQSSSIFLFLHSPCSSVRCSKLLFDDLKKGFATLKNIFVKNTQSVAKCCSFSRKWKKIGVAYFLRREFIARQICEAITTSGCCNPSFGESLCSCLSASNFPYKYYYGPFRGQSNHSMQIQMLRFIIKNIKNAFVIWHV